MLVLNTNTYNNNCVECTYKRLSQFLSDNIKVCRSMFTCNRIWFKHYNHTENSHVFLKLNFRNDCIGSVGPVAYPLRSSDLTTFIWSVVKNVVCQMVPNMKESAFGSFLYICRLSNYDLIIITHSDLLNRNCFDQTSCLLYFSFY